MVSRISKFVMLAFGLFELSSVVECGQTASVAYDQFVIDPPALPVVCKFACIQGTHCQNGICVADSLRVCKYGCIRGFHCQNGRCVRDTFDKCQVIRCAAGYRCFQGRCMRFISIDPITIQPINDPIPIDDPIYPVDRRPISAKVDPSTFPVDPAPTPDPLA